MFRKQQTKDRKYKGLGCQQRDMCLSLVSEASREEQNMVQSANLHGRHSPSHPRKNSVQERDLDGTQRILIPSYSQAPAQLHGKRPRTEAGVLGPTLDLL